MALANRKQNKTAQKLESLADEVGGDTAPELVLVTDNDAPVVEEEILSFERNVPAQVESESSISPAQAEKNRELLQVRPAPVVHQAVEHDAQDIHPDPNMASAKAVRVAKHPLRPTGENIRWARTDADLSHSIKCSGQEGWPATRERIWVHIAHLSKTQKMSIREVSKVVKEYFAAGGSSKVDQPTQDSAKQAPKPSVRYEAQIA